MAARPLRLHDQDGKREPARRRCAKQMIYDITVDGKVHRLELEKTDKAWQCRLDGANIEIDAVIPRSDVLSLLVDGRSYEIKREQSAKDVYLWVGNRRFAVELRDPRSLRSRR